MATRSATTRTNLPEAWLRPCLVIGPSSRTPLRRGTIGRLRRALDIASTAEHDRGPDAVGVNRYHPRTGKPSSGVPRKLRTPCKHLVTQSRTDYGERELSIETSDLDIEPIRFRIWMPDVDHPIDPDFSSRSACLRNLRSHIALLRAHLTACGRAMMHAPAPDVQEAIRAATLRAGRVGAVASTWTDRKVMVETNTPWSPMRIHHLDNKGIPRGEFLGTPEQTSAWATEPCLSVRMEGGRGSPLIVSITALRVELRSASVMEAMRAAAHLPQPVEAA
jgi:hypothetical protein